MPSQPPTSLFPPSAKTLTGGCLCSAVRYTLTIPEVSSRPAVPNALPTPLPPLSAQSDNVSSTLPTTYPILELDHCGSCRHASGSIIQCWLVLPLSWARFHLLPREASGTEAQRIHDLNVQDVLLALENVREKTYVLGYCGNGASHRPFCGRCGSGIGFYWHAEGEAAEEEDEVDVFDIAAGTLDDESLEVLGSVDDEEKGGIGIQRHSHWESGVRWIKEGMYRAWPRVRHPGGLPVDVVEREMA